MAVEEGQVDPVDRLRLVVEAEAEAEEDAAAVAAAEAAVSVDWDFLAIIDFSTSKSPQCKLNLFVTIHP